VQYNKTFILLVILAVTAVPMVHGQYDFTVSSTEGCTPFRVKYAFVSTALVDSVASYSWDFGNGDTSSLVSPDTVQYNTAGTYTVKLSLTFLGGGAEDIEKSGYLTVHHAVPANFTYYDTITYTTYVLKHNEPLDIGPVYSFLWNIEGFPDAPGPSQLIAFPDTGIYTVTLTVADDQGCTSKVTHDIQVYQEITVQNVFSPNNDGANDIFVVTSHEAFPLRLRIFTRTGILVYEIEGSTVIWNGFSASGQEMKQGIYFYTLEAISGDPAKRFSRAGTLYLFK